MSSKIKKDDIVVVISGAARNLGLDQRTGKVLSVDHKKQRVTVENINVRRSTVRRSQSSPEGGFVEKESSIHISNVMLKETYDSRSSRRAGDAN